MIQQPQAGIAALPTAAPQQPQAPGQAPGIQQALPQMQPQVTGPMSAPQSFVSPLKGRDLSQLLQEFNNPQSQYPKYAVLAAMKERQEADRMRSAVQGQGAMQQAQQQRGSVANEVVAQAQAGQQPPPVMAAQGGIMRGYASGGPVAFAPGGGVSQEFGDSPEAFAMDELRIREAQIAKKRAEDRARYEFLKETAPEVAARMAQENPELALPRVPAAAPQQLPPVPPPPLPPAPPRQTPPGPPAPPRRNPALGAAAAADTGLPALVPPASTELSPGMRQAYENRMSALRTQQGVPEDILAGRAGLSSLMQEMLASQQAEAKTYGEEARAAQAAAEARQKRGPTAQELFALAGGIDTRKGQGMGSLARTASGLLGARETAAEAARKEYGAAQREQRGMQANVRQTQMLEAQRQQALREKDYDRANQIQSQIDTLAIEREKFGVERGDTAFTQDVERRKLDLQKRGLDIQKSAAYRPTAQEFMYGLYKKGELPGYLAAQQDPKTEGAMLRDVVAAAMKNPLMLNMYPPEIQELIKQEMRKLGGDGAGTAKPGALKYNPATGKIE